MTDTPKAAIRIVRGVHWRGMDLAAGDVVELPAREAAELVWSNKAVPHEEAPTEEVEKTEEPPPAAPIEASPVEVEHRDPPAVRRRGGRAG